MRTLGALVLVCAVGSIAHADDDLDLLARAAAQSHAGDHAGAAELYDRAYRETGDTDLLVLVGVEQGRAGHVDEALQSLCTYLTFESTGAQAALAVDQVAQLQGARGIRVDPMNVCASPSSPLRPPGAVAPDTQPMLPPAMAPTFDRELPTTNSGLSQRQIAGIAVGGVGLASLGLSAIYAMRAQDISDTIAGHSSAEPWPADIRDREARGAHAEWMSTALLVGGAAAITTGAVLYVTGRPAREHILVAPSGSGISVRGAF